MQQIARHIAGVGETRTPSISSSIAKSKGGIYIQGYNYYNGGLRYSTTKRSVDGLTLSKCVIERWVTDTKECQGFGWGAQLERMSV